MQLCEILSIGTEDSLSIFFVYLFVPELLGLLNHKNNPDIMLLVARALTHLVDILPSSCVALLHYGAVLCFLARLLTIEYMDLAEQALKKICQVHPSAYFRAALATAAHMCKKLPSDASDLVLPMCFFRLGNERILGSSLNPLNPLQSFTSTVPALPRGMPENVNPRLRTSYCPWCKEKYDLELAKLVSEFENSSSEAKLEFPQPQLPQWLQNDMLKHDSNVTSSSQGEEKVNRYVHLLNSTLTATERTACWILEKYHKEDGVEISKVLRSYMSGKTSIPFQEMSIDLSLEDVKHVSLYYGFVFEKESTIETTYTTNSRSMLQERPVDDSSIITVCSPLRGVQNEERDKENDEDIDRT
ncbi:Serine--tRNA ligase [Capsicum chinense]|nr:Serine--tRNA ligase [Capsicum chinense]